MNVDRVSTAVVDRAIDQASARLRTVSALSGALLIGAGAIAYVALAVFADHFFAGGLSLTVRRAGLAFAAILVVTFTATRVIRPAVRRINQLYSAWLLERARPDLCHAVTTTLLLRGRSDVHAGVSSGLAFQAARAVRRIDVAGVVPDKSLRRAGIAIVAVIASFGLYGLLAPKQVRPSVLRVLGADVPPPTQTSVDIIAPGPDASVVVGTPVAFEVAIRGRLPEESWVEFSPDEGKTWPPGKRLNLAAPTDRFAKTATWTAARDGADVATTLWYRVHAGDARCEIRKLEVRPQPVVTAQTVEITWPEYSNRQETTRTDGPIDALIGSKAALTVRTNVPAADGRVIFHDASGDFSRQMSIDDSDRHMLRAAWVVDRDLEYEVQFNDLHGAENPSPIRYTQRARGDRPPEIAQSAPQAKFSAAPTDSFQVRARITDDWGLSKLVLSYRGIRSTGVIDLTDDAVTGRPIVEVDETISVESLGAASGDVVELHLEATDSRVNLRGASDPQVTRGPACELRVTGEKGGKGSGGSQDQTGGKGAPGPNKGGNQLAGGGDGPGQGNDKGRPGKSDPGEKAGGDAQASSKNDPSDEDTAASAGAEPENANQPGEKGKPERTELQTGTESDESKDKGPVTDGEAPASAKPTPSDNSDNTTPPKDAGTPGSKPNSADRDSDAQPMDDAAGEDPTDAQAEMDRLIHENKEVVERLANKASGTSETGESTESGNDEGKSPKGDGADKKEDSADSGGSKPSRKGDNSEDSTKSGGKPDAGMKEAGDASSDQGEKSSEQSGNGEQGKPGSDSEPTGDGAKPADGQTGDKSDAGTKTDKKNAVEGPRGPSESDGASKSGDSKGEAKAKPGDAQPSEGESKGKSDSGAFAKDPAKNGESKTEEPGASTPKPADAVGPTPKSSSGGVAQDAGPGQPDGEFEGGEKSEPLDAPLRDRARKAVDELERRLRDGGVSDAELRDLGWSRAEARNFVTRYRRLQKAAQKQRDGGLFSGRVRENNGDAKSSSSDSISGVGRGMAGAVRGDSGSVKDTAHAQEAPPESVPPELKDVLDEYYRSMARQGGAKAKSDK